MINLLKFETNITSACTNTCINCDHYSPLQKPYFTDPKLLEIDLAAAAKIMHAGVYGLIGGEPLLHPKLIEIMEIAKSSKIADQLIIWTNGQLLPRMPDDFWNLVDIISVTVYPNLHHEPWIINACQKWGKTYRRTQHANFSKTFSTRAKPNSEATEIFRRCIYRSCNEYDDGYFYHCNNGRYIAQLLHGYPKGTDGIYLPTATEEQFRNYLERQNPFVSCTWCVQTKLSPVTWRNVPREDWLVESESDL